MTAAEFRAWRKARRLTQEAAAQLLAVSIVTVRRAEQAADDDAVPGIIRAHTHLVELIESLQERLDLFESGRMETADILPGGGRRDTTQASIHHYRESIGELRSVLAARREAS